MSTYLLAAISIDDLDAYSEYVERGMAATEKYHVNVLAVDDRSQLLEGESPGKRIVLMEFDDEDALQKFYHSEEYQAAIPIRHEHAETRFLMSINGLAQD